MVSRKTYLISLFKEENDLCFRLKTFKRFSNEITESKYVFMEQ